MQKQKLLGLAAVVALVLAPAMARADLSDSTWLRDQYAQTRSMPDVVRAQALRWREDETAGASHAK